MSQILVIDDDMELCDLLKDYLGPEGYEMETAHEGQSGLERALSGDHGLVVLDVMLPGINGFDVLREIRKRSSIPVIMLTARGDDVDRIVGLELGADDYLPKPFNPRELIARIRAVQRRTESDSTGSNKKTTAPKTFTDGDITFDPGNHKVTIHGRDIPLTSVEFSLFYELLKNAGDVVSRDDLAERVLGRKLSLFDRSIDVHVSSLRKKLGYKHPGMERIKSVRGVGYLYLLAQDAISEEGN
ncbi:MAG: response regulator transcription factor [Desulfobacteraceae bacterium]|nr:response regulator transcription factor [Desulfobacteraceae bacterium]